MFPLAWAASPAHAEMQIGVYGGWNGSFDSDIHLSQPNRTNMTLSDVPWDGDSSGDPPYWGLRGTYWFNNAPSWGVIIDYNHAKVIADQGAVVSVSGTRDGIPVGPTDRVGNTFQVMEFTDGLNEIYLGGQYRWIHDRWTPYVGFGVGVSFPHVEVRRVGPGQPYTFEYQLDGVAVEGLVGLEYHVTPRVSIFGDYKLSFSSNDAELNGGGSLQTDVRTTRYWRLLPLWRGAGPGSALVDPAVGCGQVSFCPCRLLLMAVLAEAKPKL
jgi:lipid A oxidase